MLRNSQLKGLKKIEIKKYHNTLCKGRLELSEGRWLLHACESNHICRVWLSFSITNPHAGSKVPMGSLDRFTIISFWSLGEAINMAVIQSANPGLALLIRWELPLFFRQQSTSEYQWVGMLWTLVGGWSCAENSAISLDCFHTPASWSWLHPSLPYHGLLSFSDQKSDGLSSHAKPEWTLELCERHSSDPRTVFL